MRTIVSVLLASLFAVACDDGVSPPNPCELPMDQAQAAFGTPDEVTEEENAGDFFEIWTYDADASAQGRLIVFRWGATVEGCAIEPPDLFS